MSIVKNPLNRRRLVQASAGVLAGSLVAPSLVGARSRRYHPAMLQTNPVSGKVLMWVYPLIPGGEEKNEEIWADIVSQFTADNPDAEVKVEVLPWAQRNEKLTTALAAKSGPDVGYLNDDFIPQHGGEGNLQALDDVLGDDKADFTENSLGAMSVEGTLYALPILGSVTTAIYNQKLFDEVGIDTLPTTWDELLELGPAFKDAGYYVTGYNGSLEETLNLSYYPLLWQAGGEVLNEEQTAAAFNDDAGIAALDFIKTLYDEEFINQDEAVTPAVPGAGAVVEGKVAVVITGDSVSISSMEEKLGEGTVTIGAPFKNVNQVSYGTSAGFGVFKDAKDPDAAKAWVKYITSSEPMKEILLASGFIAPRLSLTGIHADDPVLGSLEGYIDLMHGSVRHTQSRAINAAMAPYVQAAFLGESSVEDALAEAEDEVNRLIERG
ncbi:MAG TPA: sugar ABC transporter substrate-binding protein [Thermomicrobiales bacterium]|nr:sugar ABC transporter substrate-binding protein [Thermomicrobiales bacterium]